MANLWAILVLYPHFSSESPSTPLASFSKPIGFVILFAAFFILCYVLSLSINIPNYFQLIQGSRNGQPIGHLGAAPPVQSLPAPSVLHPSHRPSGHNTHMAPHPAIPNSLVISNL